MTDEKLTIGELGGYTNNSMNREGLKKLVDKVNNGGSSGDAYTKAETDALLAEKADADDVYTKTEIDTELSEKADITDVYTKTEVDTELADKQDVLTAGTGIDITNNVISATGGSGGDWTLRTPNNDWSDLIDSTTMTTLKEILIIYKSSYYNIPKGYQTVGGNPIRLKNIEFGNYSDYIQIVEEIEIERNKIASSSTTFKRVVFSINKALDTTTNTLTVKQENLTMNKAGFTVYTKD